MCTQLAAATGGVAWSFTISCILLFIINRIPVLKLSTGVMSMMRCCRWWISPLGASSSGVNSIRVARTTTTVPGAGLTVGEEAV
jgi:hypothetical protein